MATYNYDRENAEKAYEYIKYKRAQYTLGNIEIINHFIILGAATGTVFAIYARPVQRGLAHYNAFFRKPWMRLPVLTFAFICGFYGGIQLPSRVFYKFSKNNSGISHAVYTSS